MKLRPILRPEAQAAASMLAEGFPEHPRETWQESIRALFSRSAHGEDGSIGYIASAGGRDVGVSLAIPGCRSAYELAPRKVVNLAGFYLRPGNEWMATPFLRRIMKDPAVDYVDLTASAAMREVNRRLGFVDRSRGMVVVPTAIAALRPSRGARVFLPADLSPGMMSADHRALLDQHARLGAISIAVEVDGVCHPLIFARSFHKKVRSARVLLARDRELLRAVIGPLSRHLLRLGIGFLEFDSMERAELPESLFVSRAATVQSTRPSQGAAIDHTFCELIFIPPVTPWRALALPPRRGSTAFPFPLGMADIGIAAPAAACLVTCLVEAALT